MPDFTFSGGVRFNATCVADVTMDPATGDPLTCKNPITGAEISGGGGDNYAVTCTSNGASYFGFYNSIESYQLAFTISDGSGSFIVGIPPAEDSNFWYFEPESGFSIEGEYEETIVGGDTVWKITGDCTITFTE